MMDDEFFFTEIVVEGTDPTLRQKVKSMLGAGLPDVIPAAALIRDVETLRAYLEKNPQDVYNFILKIKKKRKESVLLYLQVNFIKSGQGALHLAVIRGYISVVKTILQFNPDVNIMVQILSSFIDLYILAFLHTCRMKTGKLLCTSVLARTLIGHNCPPLKSPPSPPEMIKKLRHYL